ncbi:MAG: hypothetical protein ACOYN0_15485, partial [Phycisphaerales bacterium]
MTADPKDPPDASGTPDPGSAPTSDPGAAAAPSSKRDRDLIEAAIQNVTPFEATPAFDGDLPPADTFPGYDLIREI